MSNFHKPRIGSIVTPLKPSTPPVIDDALFAASHSIKPMPSVTISRVRSPPRTTRKLTR